MPTWEVDIRGTKIPIEAADEAEAKTKALQLSQQPQYAQSGVVEDVAKAAPSAFARGTADLIGLPGTVGGALEGGMDWAMRKGYEGVTGKEPSPQGGGLERFFAGPTPEVEAAMTGNPLGGASLKAGLSTITGGATDYQPKTTAGEYARTVGEFAPAALAGPGGVLAKTAMATIPAVTSETAGQLTEGTVAEPYARVGGALAGGPTAARVMKSKTPQMPTAKEIKASAGYDDLKEPMKAARINKDTYQRIVSDLRAVADDFGMVPEKHGAFKTILLRHQQLAKKGASMHDLEIMRRSLLHAGKDPLNPSAGALSGQLLDQFEKSVRKISSGNVNPVEGAAGDELLNVLDRARETWKIGSAAAVVEKAMEKAQKAASGYENGLRIEFRKILENEKLARQFTPTQKLSMQQVVKGTFKGNMLRLLGGFGIPLDNARNFLGSVIGGGVGGSIGSMVAGPMGAAIGGPLLMGIGTAAKAGSNAVTRNQAKLTEALVKAGPKAAEIFAEALKANQSGGREAILRALLQGQSASQVPIARERAR